jgi:hypothetical protein
MSWTAYQMNETREDGLRPSTCHLPSLHAITIRYNFKPWLVVGIVTLCFVDEDKVIGPNCDIISNMPI